MKVQGIDATVPAPQLEKGPRAAEAFEAYLIGFLCKQMREAVPDGPLNSGAAGMFADLLDQEIGKRAAEGQGIGLRRELETALARHGEPAPLPIAPLEIRHPLPAHDRASAPPSRVTSGFGLRIDPIDGTTRRHDGLDIGLPAGTPIHAERSGVVSFAGERGGYGNVVILNHGDGLETRYAHCASLNVRAGDQVAEGEVVGTVGSTGRSTGPHLHFEVRQDGEPVDPTAFLEKNR